jgi:hypothetical protein
LISADVAFERVADAAAAAFAAQPPYIAYRVDVRATAESLVPLESHYLSLRTVDGKALVRSSPGATATVDAPLPLGPSVDALAEWAFSFDAKDGSARLNVAYEHPVHYVAPQGAPGDTVVVASVAGYALSYAANDANQLHVEPATAAMRAFAAQANHFVYRDVWFDPATYLPTRVVLAAVDETLTLDYTVVGTHWLLHGFTYDGRLDELRRDGEPATIEATYSAYTFPASVTGL